MSTKNNNRTVVLGAILLTGYLGGAIATHVKDINPNTTNYEYPILRRMRLRRDSLRMHG